jgi:hypothetical protein
MRRSTLVVGALLLGFSSLLPGQDLGDAPHGDLTLDCSECHDPKGWLPVEKPPSFRHDTTGFTLKASHAQVSCRGCHQSLVFHRVGTACVDCHQDAHRGELGFRCESCHTPGTWTNQREMFQAHSGTRFPLLAVHARLDCAACHAEQRPWEYATTPAECSNCHLETYLQTTDPSHLEAGFSRRCEDCHQVTASTWRGPRFSHPERFPLAGGHARLACARCHTGGSYASLSPACVSCHQPDYAAATDPGHISAGFPTTCEGCHTIQAWRPATFDHNLSRFPLTGAHTRIDCSRCHEGGRYQGTPTDCNSCHRAEYAGTANPNHQASGFPTQCQACHTTTAWRPASFDHDGRSFPIYSGEHRGKWSSCSDCHVNPGNFRAFECIFCHEHSNRAEMDEEHEDESGYSYQSAACYRCHRRGKADSLGGPHRLKRAQ